MESLGAPRGTRDILPEESARWRQLEAKFDDICERFGYGEIRIPTFEATDIFARGVGDASDIVRKEMYSFEDRAGRSLTLRPEGTAGVVRSYIQQGMASWPTPVKLYYKLNLFRYEAVQKGRQREFNQFGVECFGSSSPALDAEVISLVHRYLRSLGLSELRLEINSLGSAACRQAYQEKLREWLAPQIGHFCEDCQARFESNPLRILDCKVPEDQARLSEAPLLLEHLDEESARHFDSVKKYLEAMDIPYVVNPRIVRGLDYYSHTVFEFISEHVGTQGTICGGGRYDQLVEQLGGPATPACGFAMGVERLLLELEANQALPAAKTQNRLFLAGLDAESRAAALQLADALRQAGLACQSEICDRSLRAQMKYANKSNYRYIIVLGSDELAQQRAKLRDLSDGSEVEVSLNVEDILAALQPQA